MAFGGADFLSRTTAGSPHSGIVRGREREYILSSLGGISSDEWRVRVYVPGTYHQQEQ